MYEDLETIEMELDDELEEELDEDLIEEDSYLLLRDVLDQNIEKQHLPNSDKFDLFNEDNPRNTIYKLNDDALIRLYDKSIHDYKEMSGQEYNEYLIDEYGTNLVEYVNGEPNFNDYIKEITNEDISNYLEEEITGNFNGIGKLDKTISSIERHGVNGTIDEAYHLIADELGCDFNQVKDYIRDHNLVIHEANKDEFELISSDIHDVFKHTGSIGIKKDLEVLKESILDKCDSNSLVLERMDETYEAKGVNDAILETKKHNREIKRN